MARFKFNLENVLNIKVKMEEQKKMELGNANKILVNLQEELLEIDAQRVQYINDFYEEKGKVLKAFDLAKLNKYIKFYNDRMKEQKIKINQAECVVEEKREELKQALFEKKKYEVLKERAYERYAEEEKQEENKIVDEIINYKYRSNE